MMISLIGLSEKLAPKQAQFEYAVTELEIKEFSEIVDIAVKYHWAPGIFGPGEKLNNSGELQKADHYKAAEFFKTTQLIGIDIDEGLSLEDGIKIFGGYKCIIGTTKSHQKPKDKKPACDRFRVIIKLRVPINRENMLDYPATYNYLNKMGDNKLDSSCQNVARYFNACAEVVHINLNGVELQPIEAPKQLISAPPVLNISENTRGNLSYKTKDFLENGAKDGEKHHRLYLAVKDLQEQLYPPSEIYSLIERPLSMFQKSEGYNDAAARRTIQDALKDPPKFPPRVQPFPKMVQFKKDGPWQPDKTHPENVKHFLYNVYGISKIYWQKYFGTGVYIDDETVTDNVLNCIRVAGRNSDLSMSVDLYDAVISSEAVKNERNPIRDFVFEKPWDKVDRFDALYKSLDAQPQNQEDEDFFRKFLKKWFVSMVVQAVTEGGALVGKNIINQIVLVLQAGQGKGKSRWLASLVPDGKYFVDGFVKPDNKDHEIRLMNSLIWHASEFETITSKKAEGELKAFFNKGFIDARIPYARKPIQARQVCSFVASANGDDFLHDLTGNRRYPVIPVGIQNSEHGIDLQQLYAQSFYEYEQGYVYYPTYADNDEISNRADRYIAESITDMWMSGYAGDIECKARSFQELYSDYAQWCKDKSYNMETTYKVSQRLTKKFKDFKINPQNKAFYKIKTILNEFDPNSIISMSNKLLEKFN